LTSAGRLALVRAACVAAGVLIVDQTTKALVRGGIERGASERLLPGVDLVNTRNTGVAFSLFSDGGTLLLVFTAIAMAGVLVFFLRRPERPLVWLPAGLLLGGAVGNAIDRVLDGSVTDFVDLPLWPAFNVADVAITVGVAALFFVLERHA
jgi:signal peptidase II